jgi:hypothetical protein
MAPSRPGSFPVGPAGVSATSGHRQGGGEARPATRGLRRLDGSWNLRGETPGFTFPAAAFACARTCSARAGVSPGPSAVRTHEPTGARRCGACRGACARRADPWRSVHRSGIVVGPGADSASFLALRAGSERCAGVRWMSARAALPAGCFGRRPLARSVLFSSRRETRGRRGEGDCAGEEGCMTRGVVVLSDSFAGPGWVPGNPDRERRRATFRLPGNAGKPCRTGTRRVR